MPFMTILPAVPILSLIALIAYWIIVDCYLASMTKFVPLSSPTDFLNAALGNHSQTVLSSLGLEANATGSGMVDGGEGAGGTVYTPEDTSTEPLLWYHLFGFLWAQEVGHLGPPVNPW
jgi:hypothetical protein